MLEQMRQLCMRITEIKRLIRNDNTGCLRMRLLREVESQHERFSSRVLDFDTAAGKCGLSNESNLGIDFAELHILVISHFEFSNTPASTIRVE